LATGFFATGFFATGFFATGAGAGFLAAAFAAGLLVVGLFATGFRARLVVAFLADFLAGFLAVDLAARFRTDVDVRFFAADAFEVGAFLAADVTTPPVTADALEVAGSGWAAADRAVADGAGEIVSASRGRLLRTMAGRRRGRDMVPSMAGESSVRPNALPSTPHRTS